MGVDQVPETHKNGRNFHEKEHHAKDCQEVHEGECRVKCDNCDQVVANHLLVKRLQRFHVDQYDDSVHEEVAARINYAPNVQITWHIDTLLVIEDCPAVSAQIKHRNCAYSYAQEGKDWRNYILAVLGSFLRRHLRIGLVACDQDGMPN